MQVGDPGMGVALPQAPPAAQAPSAKPQAAAFSVPTGAQPPSAKPKAAAWIVPLEAQPPFSKPPFPKAPFPKAAASGTKKADADKTTAQPTQAAAVQSGAEAAKQAIIGKLLQTSSESAEAQGMSHIITFHNVYWSTCMLAYRQLVPKLSFISTVCQASASWLSHLH